MRRGGVALSVVLGAVLGCGGARPPAAPKLAKASPEEQKAIADQDAGMMGYRGMRHGYGARAG